MQKEAIPEGSVLRAGLPATPWPWSPSWQCLPHGAETPPLPISLTFPQGPAQWLLLQENFLPEHPSGGICPLNSLQNSLLSLGLRVPDPQPRSGVRHKLQQQPVPASSRACPGPHRTNLGPVLSKDFIRLWLETPSSMPVVVLSHVQKTVAQSYSCN